MVWRSCMCLYYRGILKNWTKSKCYLILHFLTSKTIGTFTARSNLDPTVTRNFMERDSPFSCPTFHRLRADNWLASSRRSVGGVRREVREPEKVRRQRGGNACEISFQKVIPPTLLASNPTLVSGVNSCQSSNGWQTALFTELCKLRAQSLNLSLGALVLPDVNF